MERSLAFKSLKQDMSGFMELDRIPSHFLNNSLAMFFYTEKYVRFILLRRFIISSTLICIFLKIYFKRSSLEKFSLQSMFDAADDTL